MAMQAFKNSFLKRKSLAKNLREVLLISKFSGQKEIKGRYLLKLIKIFYEKANFKILNYES